MNNRNIQKINRFKRTGSYNYQKPVTHKDNRNIYDELPGDCFWDGQISIGDGVEYSPSVRVPKLCRKTTWKRFYKLYPHLRGMNSITGHSSSSFHLLNPSTIKLKKVK